MLGDNAISQTVLDYVNVAVRRDVGAQSGFDLYAAPISFDLQQLHAAFLNDQINITKIAVRCVKWSRITHVMSCC